MKFFRLLLASFLLVFLPLLPVFAQTFTDAMSNYHAGRDYESRNQMGGAEIYYKEAIWICNNEISRNRANRDTYTVLTWVYQRQKKYADVITWGERGLALYEDEYRIMETMGEAYFYLNDYEQSLHYFQRYTNSVPQGERTSIAYFFIGEIYRLRNQYRHADVAYSAAVRLEPGVALWWYRLGLVREEAEDFQQAIIAYEQAIKLNPDYREANDGLARSGREAGR